MTGLGSGVDRNPARFDGRKPDPSFRFCFARIGRGYKTQSRRDVCKEFRDERQTEHKSVLEPECCAEKAQAVFCARLFLLCVIIGL